MKTIRVAMLGCGEVGSAVSRLLSSTSEDLTARCGAQLELIGVAVRDLKRDRSASGLDPALFTTDAETLVDSADLVIEVMGGIEPARSLILRALRNKASVVTANKALLAADGPAIYECAQENGVDVLFEASVAGAIPLLRPLRESLAGDVVQRILGIVNGTTNYILDQMDAHGATYEDALAKAQELGYAEADPTADVEGDDAAAKAGIIASLAYHTRISGAEVAREGISTITPADIQAAKELDSVIKLLAICERSNGGVSVRVHPAMIPRSHPLANVRDAFNAVFVESDAAGQLMFYGRGAGGDPTASAVLGDVVSAARNRAQGMAGVGESAYAGLPLVSNDQAITRYCVRLVVADRPGELSRVAATFAVHQVSIALVRQEAAPVLAQDNVEEPTIGSTEGAELVVVTHAAREEDLAATVRALQASSSVRRVASVIRLEGL